MQTLRATFVFSSFYVFFLFCAYSKHLEYNKQQIKKTWFLSSDKKLKEIALLLSQATLIAINIYTNTIAWKHRQLRSLL